MRTIPRLPFLLLLAALILPAIGAQEVSPLDGRWVARYTTSPDASYEMEFSGDRFHAVAGEQWYKGKLTIDNDSEPARIDFTILACECGFAGKTSEGIFRWDGESIEMRSPQPGDPRPAEFDTQSGETMRLTRENN